MSVIVSGNEIVLNGTVGDMSGGWGWDDCFTATDVIIALAQIGNSNDVVVRLNSGGGIATEGSAIHSALARHKGKKTIIVEGIAASAASVIAMAGDDVVLALGAILMIHDPSGWTVGTITDHEMQINALTALGDAMATIYAAKSGQSVEVCRADMKAETWMTAEQAVTKGYADSAQTGANDNDEPGNAVEVIEPAPFNYALYAHAPQQMVAMTKAKRWDKPAPPKMEITPPAPAPTEAEPPPQQENEMTEAEIQARIDDAVRAATTGKDAEIAAATAAAKADALSPALAADIAKACLEGGVPTMTASLLGEKGMTIDKAKARIDAAGQITAAVTMARKQNPVAIAEDAAAAFIAAGQTVEQVKVALFEKMAAADEAKPLQSFHRAAAGGTDHAGKTADREKSRANMEAQVNKSGLSPKKEG